MAILRGGVRIFGQDIRLGIPRDKSLVNVAGDKRLKRRPGNPGSTIGQFISQVNKGEGLARPTRYLVRFYLNPKVEMGWDPLKEIEITDIADEFNMERTDPQTKRNVEMMCNKVTMPSRDINTTPHITYGPKREMPYAVSYGSTIECNFYADKYLRQRHFFEKWQGNMFGEHSHDMNYYSNYTGHMDIYQLGASGGAGDRDRITYAVRLEEVYPETIGSIEYSYGDTNSYVNVPITLRFRKWQNLFADDIWGVEHGAKQGKVPTVKEAPGSGLFGGLLSKLPPELQRAARQISGAAKRNLPVGRVTGGRVFPPFGPLT